MILYFFYKNFLLTIPQYYELFLNCASGNSIFDDYYITFYNLFFTAAPLIITATLDWDIIDRKLVKVIQNGK